MIYKVLRKFTDDAGKLYKAGTYVDIDPRGLKIRTRIRRRDLLLARDQKGAKRLIEVDKPKGYQPKPQEKQKAGKLKQKVKNAKINKKQ